MKMKRYFAPDSRQALRALRDEQGPDAVILSNRCVSGGVEIIAAMDYEDAMSNVLENTLENGIDNNIKHSDESMSINIDSKQKNHDVAVSVENNEGKNTTSVNIIGLRRCDTTSSYSNSIQKTLDSGEVSKNLLSEEINKEEVHVQSKEKHENTKSNIFDEPEQKQRAPKECIYQDRFQQENRFESMSFDKTHDLEKQEQENSAALNKIRDELTGLRNIMEAPLMQFSWGETDRVRPLYASLLKQLMTLGLSAKLSQVIAKTLAKEGLTKKSWGESLNHLSQMFPINHENIISSGGIVSLVGPTGVGKTTTIAKLAAHFALKYGRKGVTLITTDNYRIGAHEQLRSYGRILGIPVHVASDSNELKALLEEAKNKSCEHQLTLIDTAGVSQKDINLTEQITSLDIDGTDIKNYLVLSATGQMSLQHEVVNAFSKIDLSGCVITKTDEAASLGEVISVVIEHNLPVSYICDGQKVPDDIHQAQGKSIVQKAVKLMTELNKSLSNEELAYSFGGVVKNASF